jgi:SAM-dependent methyltransferase
MKAPQQISRQVFVDLLEPLAESAPLAHAWANRFCDRSDPDSSCYLYHSAWQYFRLIGLLKTIASDDDFLGDALLNLASTGRFDRVLISGSADYGMLARVIHVYRKAGREPRITLLDICRTPLRLNQWLADREGVALETLHGDVFQLIAERPFDLVCTHSFINQFHGRRDQLVRTLCNALRPGGCIVTTSRIRPGIKDIVRFSPAEVEAFSARAEALARACPHLGAVSAGTIAEWASAYARHKFNFPLQTCEEMTGYFTRAGMHITRLDRASTEGDRPSGPSQGISSERIRLIATRP